MADYRHIVHPFPPLYDENSRILILGSFPSVKSREQNFFYGHPQNRFWKVVAAVFDDIVPASIEEKKAFLHRHHIALWDSIAECDIKGSSDSSIRNAVPTDLRQILQGSQVKRIFCNGKASGTCYEKYQQPLLGIPAVTLPSTSPANAAFTMEKLIDAWSAAIKGEASEIR
ncbi:MAG: DNA-deoxyinosine glycosylase [Firmicutes bacterium]|nr:DNA-deoxyinosine glycosylase [Bacillota bacterium]